MFRVIYLQDYDVFDMLSTGVSGDSTFHPKLDSNPIDNPDRYAEPRFSISY